MNTSKYGRRARKSSRKKYNPAERKALKRAQRKPEYQRARLARENVRRTIEAQLTELNRHKPIVPKGATDEERDAGVWTTAHNTMEIRTPALGKPTRTEALREHKRKTAPLIKLIAGLVKGLPVVVDAGSTVAVAS